MAGAVLGVKTDLGDGVDANDVAFDTSFPYVAMPHSGSDVAVVATTQPAPATKLITKTRGVSSGAAAGIGIGALVIGLLLMALLRPSKPKPKQAGENGGSEQIRRVG